jgi:hypothetical protein
MKIPKIPTLGDLAALFKRGNPESRFEQGDLPPPPAGVDPLGYRIAMGHIRPKSIKRRLETLGRDDLEVRFRDAGG